MKKFALVISLSGVLASAFVTPAQAGVLGSIGSLLGSTTAAIIDTPEAMVIDTLWRVPMKTEQALAEKFGDQNGLEQNIAATVIGVPVGVVWGIPTGFFRGAKHGLGTGWEKPFSAESFIVGFGDKD